MNCTKMEVTAKRSYRAVVNGTPKNENLQHFGKYATLKRTPPQKTEDFSVKVQRLNFGWSENNSTSMMSRKIKQRPVMAKNIKSQPNILDITSGKYSIENIVAPELPKAPSNNIELKPVRGSLISKFIKRETSNQYDQDLNSETTMTSIEFESKTPPKCFYERGCVENVINFRNLPPIRPSDEIDVQDLIIETKNIDFVVIDTSIFVRNLDDIMEDIIKNPTYYSKGKIYVPRVVHRELERFKKIDQFKTNFELDDSVRDSICELERLSRLRPSKYEGQSIDDQRVASKDFPLDDVISDDRILQACLNLMKNRGKKVHLLTLDKGLRTLARDMGITTSPMGEYLDVKNSKCYLLYI